MKSKIMTAMMSCGATVRPGISPIRLEHEIFSMKLAARIPYAYTFQAPR